MFSPEPRPDLPHVTRIVGEGIPVSITESLTEMLTEHWAETMMALCRIDELEVHVPVTGWLAWPNLVAVRRYRR